MFGIKKLKKQIEDREKFNDVLFAICLKHYDLSLTNQARIELLKKQTNCILEQLTERICVLEDKLNKKNKKVKKDDKKKTKKRK